jgi:N-methylhydantoinase A
MGGTTAKAGVVRRGQPSFSPDYFIGGYNAGLAIRIPVLDIVEVGTGGGSIAWMDDGGALHVGPHSAGPEQFLGGEMRLEGNVIAGPAIIEEAASVTGVEPEDTVEVNAFGHLAMRLGVTP